MVLGKLNTYVPKNEIRTFPNAIYKDKLKMEIITQVQETQRVTNWINPRRNTPRHINKHKEKYKSSKGKATNKYMGISLRIIAALSIETLQARRELHAI